MPAYCGIVSCMQLPRGWGPAEEAVGGGVGVGGVPSVFRPLLSPASAASPKLPRPATLSPNAGALSPGARPSPRRAPGPRSRSQFLAPQSPMLSPRGRRRSPSPFVLREPGGAGSGRRTAAGEPWDPYVHGPWKPATVWHPPALHMAKQKENPSLARFAFGLDPQP